MKLWLVCFLILFFGAEAAQWLGQLPWVGSAVSLPLTVVGGIGLAIASNYRHWPSLGASEKAESPPLPPPATPPPSTPVAASVPPPRGSRKTDTISFEIKKPQGNESEGMRR